MAHIARIDCLHGLVAKAGNPLFTSCFASLERIGLVPVVPGFESPFASRAVDVDGVDDVDVLLSAFARC